MLATAKRARQLIDGAEPKATAKCQKPLSIAVEEIASGKVKILSEEEAAKVAEEQNTESFDEGSAEAV